MKQTLKKAMSVFLSAVMMLCISASMGKNGWIKAEAAEKIESGYYECFIDDDGIATLTDVDASISGEVTVPAALNERCPLITNIGDYAFYYCTKVTYVHIGFNISRIGEYAFWYCLNLEKIGIGAGVKNIGCYAFKDCDKLSDVYYDGSEAEWKNISIGEGNECLTNATIHYNFCDPEESTIENTTALTTETTSKPETETSTTPSTTKPAEPSTTKPSETSTSKNESIEEEIIKKPSTSTVKYGETLILHVNNSNIPENAKIEWSIEGKGVTIKPSEDGKTCSVTSSATGDVTIKAKYIDSNGVEHISEQKIESNASIWQKIVSFFKNLFRINRVITQTIKFDS